MKTTLFFTKCNGLTLLLLFYLSQGIPTQYVATENQNRTKPENIRSSQNITRSQIYHIAIITIIFNQLINAFRHKPSSGL